MAAGGATGPGWCSRVARQATRGGAGGSRDAVRESRGLEEQYEEFSRKMFGGKDAPDEPIAGLIIHTAGQTERGFRIFDVWESRADYERFMKEYVEPAMEGDMTPEQMQQMP